jgi:hypothetical protein
LIIATTQNQKPTKMKNLTTTIIALLTIATSVFADNTNPTTTSVISTSINNSNVAISFTAANNSQFEIERSFYSNNFTTIASANSAFGGNFKINDNAAELAGRKIAYYRVKTIAANGTVTYSNTTVVNINNNEAAAPTTASVKFTASNNGNAVITVKNAAGKTIAVKNTIAGKGANTVEVANGLTKGFYTATISVNGVTVDTQKVIAE